MKSVKKSGTKKAVQPPPIDPAEITSEDLFEQKLMIDDPSLDDPEAELLKSRERARTLSVLRAAKLLANAPVFPVRSPLGAAARTRAQTV